MRALAYRCTWAEALVVLCLFLGSCSKNGSGTDGDDGNTPFVILDVSVAAVSDSTVTLCWTATGDDADVGTATQYDIRYYHTWIQASNWDSAIQVTGEPTPRPAGQTDSMVIRDLHRDSTYYFALKVSDEAGNWTNPSNCVVAACFDDIVVDFADQNLEAIIRSTIGMPSGDIYRSDLMSVAFLDANDRGIADLTGLEYCLNLSVIFMSSNAVSDLAPLANLRKLSNVQFFDNNISDISAFANRQYIGILILRSNAISDISVLASLSSLHHLDLAHNSVGDLSPLLSNAGFAAGDTLYVSDNPLSSESINTVIPELESREVTIIQ